MTYWAMLLITKFDEAMNEKHYSHITKNLATEKTFCNEIYHIK